ncbi:hypothetical protein TREES_T100018501 [Tupaia chinensis]|uniref:Uncharacterized protein n=1 Tax=Tupaia chinensis TaxID=246437 RepID=L9KX97_TUPCH|nr:hypothetical protein TREES_T100018501 [Tupaia chinensis]
MRTESSAVLCHGCSGPRLSQGNERVRHSHGESEQHRGTAKTRMSSTTLDVTVLTGFYNNVEAQLQSSTTLDVTVLTGFYNNVEAQLQIV